MLYYFQINALCIVLLTVVLYLVLRERGALPARYVTFSRIVIATMVICISDVFAWLFNEGNVGASRFLIEFFNIVYDAAISVTCFLWLNYVFLLSLGLENYGNRRRLLNAIPLIIILIACVTNPFTDFLFSVDENNVYHRSNGIVLHWIVSWGYLIWATLVVVNSVRKSESKLEKKQLAPLISFFLPPAISAVLQMIFYGSTVLQCGITVSILFIAVSTLNEKVSKDSLTGLNNRNALDIYTDELIHRKASDVAVMMCDINKFKSINDNYGHVVGDIALRHVADVLKSACGEASPPIFLCRYGGDEFLICAVGADYNEIDRLKRSINTKLENLTLDYGTGLKLSLSEGTAFGPCTSYAEFEGLVHEADRVMYVVKDITEI